MRFFEKKGKETENEKKKSLSRNGQCSVYSVLFVLALLFWLAVPFANLEDGGDIL
jgi:hypothetical protein